jgi:hypothetical protein
VAVCVAGSPVWAGEHPWDADGGGGAIGDNPIDPENPPVAPSDSLEVVQLTSVNVSEDIVSVSWTDMFTAYIRVFYGFGGYTADHSGELEISSSAARRTGSVALRKLDR